MLAYIYLFLTIILWAAVPTAAKIALKELDNLQILLYSNLIGTIVLFLIIFLQKKMKYFSQYKPIDYLKMTGMSFLGLYLYYILLYAAFDHAPAGQANILNYLWPIFLIIFSIIFLKERFNFKTILAILLSFMGALIVFSQGRWGGFQSDFSRGYILAVMAAICYALFSVVGKKQPYETFTSMLVFYIVASLLTLPTILVYSHFVIPQQLSTILALLFLGGLANSIGFVFWFRALSLGNTHRIANIIYISPFVTLILAYFINGEVISLASILGLCCIMCGILMQLANKISVYERV